MDLKKKLLRFAIVFTVCMGALLTIVSADSGLITADNGLNLRNGPGTEYSILTAIPKGTIVNIIGAENGWIEITYNGNNGYVSGAYVSVRRTATNRSGTSVNREAGVTTGQTIVDYAAQFLGTPYVYGGSSPSGFDCSGLTSYVYRHYGYNINRVAADQASNGTAVSKSELAPGDLVLFRNGGSGIGHVGIYVGDGQFIHSVKPGVSVRYDTLNSGYYSKNFVCARRIIN